MRLTFLLIVVVATVVALICGNCALAQPWQPAVIWDRSGAEDSSRYGYAVLPLGDQNDDGFDDWAVLAAGGAFGSTDAPTLEFFHGGGIPGEQPYMATVRSFGFQGAQAVGDVNGDGYTDWLTRTYTPQQGICDASLYWGGPVADTTADLVMQSPWVDYWGTVGDFNGDGFDDFYRYHYSADFLEVFFGSESPDSVPDWVNLSEPPFSQQTAPWSYGDLNGDGYSDWFGMRLSTSTAFVFLGAADPDTIPAYTWAGLPSWPLGIVHDLNGDGADELVFRGSHSAEVCWGGATLHWEPDLSLEFPCPTPLEAISAGDINHDGYGDVVLLVDYCEAEWWGVLTVHLGGPAMRAEPAIVIEGLTPPYNLHSVWTAAGLGDVNGDSIEDLGLGAVDNLDYAGWRGRCLVLAGDDTLASGVPWSRPAIADKLTISAYPNPFNAATVLELEVPVGIDNVMLRTFNVLGQEVQQRWLRCTPGVNRIAYDARDLSSGIYVVQVLAGSRSTVQKLMVLR